MNPLETGPDGRLPTIDGRRTLLRAAGAVDGERKIAPASILIDDHQVLAVGSPESVGGVEDAVLLDVPHEVVTPALVNAHAHLDLTGLGPMPCDEGFEQWLRRIRATRPSETSDVAAAVATGIDASIRGGVVAVGDIAGALGFASASTLADSPIGGISFVEVFGIGRRAKNGLEGVRRAMEFAREIPERPGFAVGIQPHAPYSCSVETYAAAAQSGLPVSTHLAETPEEAALTRHGTGPFMDLLRTVGSIASGETIRTSGAHPIDQLLAVEPARAWLVAHLNYPAEPDESDQTLADRLQNLADRKVTVAYCPRASTFLGHPRKDRPAHPWRDLVAAGIEVALGTDGMPCLDTPDRISVLDEMRFLSRGEGAWEACQLFRMATVAGARGLGLVPEAVTLGPGPLAGLLAVPGSGTDPIRDMLARSEPPRWLLGPDRAALGVPSDDRGVPSG
jgi:cytosine/adenosine deaminase-related metal-dependent hydrolase